MPTKELIEKLVEFRVRRPGTFLSHINFSNIAAQSISSAVQNQNDGSRTARFLRLFTEVRGRYQELPSVEKAKDFHVLTNEAPTSSKSRRPRNLPRWRVMLTPLPGAAGEPDTQPHAKVGRQGYLVHPRPVATP